MAEPVSPSLLTEDQLARRQRIIDAGLALLERNEYERIQIKDVAEEADVALGTLYHYFSSKEHLFAEVLVKWAATLRANLARHPPRGLTPREKLTGALHRSVRAFQHQPQLARLIASLELSSDPFATEILERMDQTTSSVYMELLDGVEPRRARTIVRTVDAVLDSQLRAWSAGRLPITGVYDHLSESIELMFEGDPDSRDDVPQVHKEVVNLGHDGAR
jgi:TetR/AcrR family transcriptional regulator, cholesterol catabolism regulator